MDQWGRMYEQENVSCESLLRTLSKLYHDWFDNWTFHDINQSETMVEANLQNPCGRKTHYKYMSSTLPHKVKNKKTKTKTNKQKQKQTD